MDPDITKKSKTDCIKTPYVITDSPTVYDNLSKLIPFNKIPTVGVIMFSTSDVTIFPNAPQMTTATAKSSIFPWKANCLKSSHMLITSIILLIDYY